MIKRRRKPLILVIEDEADVLRFVSRVLTLEGFDVLEADNSEQGLELAHRHKCALVILDLRLPGQNGWLVLEKMKSEPELQGIPVIVFTASAGVEQRQRAFRMGAAGYLVKPLSAADIRESVTRAVKLKGGRI